MTFQLRIAVTAASNLAREAIAHAANREPEQAAAAGSRALAIAQETRSGRIVTELRRLDGALASWRTAPAAAEFRHRLRQLVGPHE